MVVYICMCGCVDIDLFVYLVCFLLMMFLVIENHWSRYVMIFAIPLVIQSNSVYLLCIVVWYVWYVILSAFRWCYFINSWWHENGKLTRLAEFVNIAFVCCFTMVVYIRVCMCDDMLCFVYLVWFMGRCIWELKMSEASIQSLMIYSKLCNWIVFNLYVLLCDWILCWLEFVIILNICKLHTFDGLEIACVCQYCYHMYH